MIIQIKGLFKAQRLQIQKMQNILTIRLLEFTVELNHLSISIQYNGETYSLEKTFDPDVDLQDVRNDFIARKFKVLYQNSLFIKVKMGYLTLVFRNDQQEIEDNDFGVLGNFDNLVYLHDHHNKENLDLFISQALERNSHKKNQKRPNESAFLTSDIAERIQNSMAEIKSTNQELQQQNDKIVQLLQNSKHKIADLQSLVIFLMQKQAHEPSYCQQGSIQIQKQIVNKTQTKMYISEVGFAVFDSAIHKNRKLWMVVQYLKNMLKQMNWTVTLDSSEELNWTQIFPYILEADCRQLHIRYAQRQSLGMEKILTRPVYSRLTELILRGNNLHNLEMLTFINAQNLKFVCIDQNYLVIPKALYKTNWKNLSKIYTKNNRILEIDFGRVKAGQATDQIQLNFSYKDEVVVQNISTFAKFESKWINYMIKIQNMTRLRNFQVQRSLKKKYHKAFDV